MNYCYDIERFYEDDFNISMSSSEKIMINVINDLTILIKHINIYHIKDKYVYMIENQLKPAFKSIKTILRIIRIQCNLDEIGCVSLILYASTFIKAAEALFNFFEDNKKYIDDIMVPRVYTNIKTYTDMLYSTSITMIKNGKSRNQEDVFPDYDDDDLFEGF